jgi:hypothetical protein
MIPRGDSLPLLHGWQAHRADEWGVAIVFRGRYLNGDRNIEEACHD